MVDYSTYWSEAYMLGVVDAHNKTVNMETFGRYILEMQAAHMSAHPEIDIKDDFFLNAGMVHELYDGYIKGVIETANKKLYKKLQKTVNELVEALIHNYLQETGKNIIVTNIPKLKLTSKRTFI